MSANIRQAEIQSEQEYQKWLRMFYKGSFLVQGWDDLKQKLLAGIPHRHVETIHLLDELGKLIGREWAKDNSIRKIDNADLKHWGCRLQRHGKHSEQALLATLREIRSEVLSRLDDQQE